MAVDAGVTAPAPQTPPPVPSSGPRGSVIAVRVIGLLVALALLTLGAASLVVQFFQQRTTETARVTEPVTRVVADADTGDLRIRPGLAGTPVQVTSVLRWSFRKPVVDLTTVDGVLTVRGDCSGRFWLSGWCSTDLEVTLPPGAALDLRTGVGDIRVTAGSGDVAAESGTGDITLAVPGSASVRAESGVGDVTVSGGSAGARMLATTGTGDIGLTLSSPPAEVQAETGTGSIDVRVPAGDSYRIDADTGVGDLRIGVPRDDLAPRRIIANTGTGDVAIRAS